jgi:hypothetical protein
MALTGQRRAANGLGTPSQQLSMLRLAKARLGAALARRRRDRVADVAERSAMSAALPPARRTRNRTKESDA